LARAFDAPITTNDQSIDRVLAAGLPVLFVFQNGPAPAPLKDAMEKLARENAGNLLVAQVQVRDNPAAAGRYQAAQTPALVAVRGGEVVSRAEPASPADLEKHAAYLLGKGPRPEPARPARRPDYTAPSPAPAPARDGQPRVVTDATFDQEVLRSPKPVLVDFWAPWCGPCRIVEPTVEKLAREMAGRASIVKVNVDENPGLSQRYAVYSIPTMMVVKNGQVVDRWAGALPEPALRSRVEPQLKS